MQTSMIQNSAVPQFNRVPETIAPVSFSSIVSNLSYQLLLENKEKTLLEYLEPVRGEEIILLMMNKTNSDPFNLLTEFNKRRKNENQKRKKQLKKQVVMK